MATIVPSASSPARPICAPLLSTEAAPIDAIIGWRRKCSVRTTPRWKLRSLWVAAARRVEGAAAALGAAQASDSDTAVADGDSGLSALDFISVYSDAQQHAHAQRQANGRSHM